MPSITNKITDIGSVGTAESDPFGGLRCLGLQEGMPYLNRRGGCTVPLCRSAQRGFAVLCTIGRLIWSLFMGTVEMI